MDWKSLIQGLIDAGMTQVQIAAECGVRQSSVSDLFRGKSTRPNYEFGRKLEALHALRAVRPTEQPPTPEPEPAAAQG
jgi:transcriptional regulator with XRE-family HTH domain